jgi:tripartite-type tricarboxylate transporter receptor subunit TctC
MGWFARFAAAAFGALFATAALAQPYPDRPVHLLVAFPPGGGANFVARLLAQLLSVRLGQSMVVENRPGSNGNVAGDLVARAAADGYTILQSSGSLFSVNPHLYATMPIDPFKDLLPVATITSDELLLTENPTLEPKSFRDFIDYAGHTKPPLLYGSIGNGSEHHLAMELLKEQAGIQMTHVPYRGGGPAAIGVMGGEVAAMFGGGSVTPLVQAGKLRALAISGRKRSPIFPNVPSISEFYPAYNVTIWQGLFVPTATPPEVVTRLRAAVNAVIAQPEFAEKRRVRRALCHDAERNGRAHPCRRRALWQGDQSKRSQGGMMAIWRSPVSTAVPGHEVIRHALTLFGCRRNHHLLHHDSAGLLSAINAGCVLARRRDGRAPAG